ncbi:MAG: MAPEG family protein, partial [Pseudomonadota bacterium]
TQLRSWVVAAQGKPANAFDPAGGDVGAFGRRLTRTHANCVENLPVAAALLLYAIAAGETAATNPLAIVFLAARIAQTSVHLASTTEIAVKLRFALYVVQLAILFWWLVQLAGVA